jgi:hypothetical protein
MVDHGFFIAHQAADWPMQSTSVVIIEGGNGDVERKKSVGNITVQRALAVLVDPTQKCTKEDRTHFIPCIKKVLGSLQDNIIC